MKYSEKYSRHTLPSNDYGAISVKYKLSEEFAVVLQLRRKMIIHFFIPLKTAMENEKQNNAKTKTTKNKHKVAQYAYDVNFNVHTTSFQRQFQRSYDVFPTSWTFYRRCTRIVFNRYCIYVLLIIIVYSTYLKTSIISENERKIRFYKLCIMLWKMHFGGGLTTLHPNSYLYSWHNKKHKKGI